MSRGGRGSKSDKLNLMTFQKKNETVKPHQRPIPVKENKEKREEKQKKKGGIPTF